MDVKQLLQTLNNTTDDVCVTLSLNTHRTHPENLTDAIKLKNMVAEAKARLQDDYEKRAVSGIVDALDQLEEEVDINQNLKSLHVFISGSVKELFRLSWPTNQEGVHIGDAFAVRPLIKELGRQTAYRIMLLSQSGVRLFRATNSKIEAEITDDNFPISESPFYTTSSDRGSDSKHVDDLVREFLNRTDKALSDAVSGEGVKTVVICTEDNYSRLLQVADNPSLYWGYVPVDYNNVDEHQLEAQAWAFVQEQLEIENEDYFSELDDAVGQGLVLTDIQEIYQACLDGRGDLLVMEEGFRQSARIADDRQLEIVDEGAGADIVDDISSLLASLVYEKGGRCIFVSRNPNPDLRPIALKARY
jgi:hypothetical protein